MTDILSQAEIDALLEAVEGGENFFPRRQVTPYDFKHPRRVSGKQMRAFRAIHDKMARSVESQISVIMRSGVDIRLHAVEQMTYGEFLMSLNAPTCFNVFSMKPLEGNGVLEINPSIAFAMLDRLLGGKGGAFEANRELSEIELSLFETVLRVMMAALREGWRTVDDLFFQVESRASGPGIAQTAAQNEDVVVIMIEIIMGQNSGMMNICYPVSALEPIFSRLESRDLTVNETGPNKSRNQELQVLLGGANVNVEVDLGVAELNLRELLELKVGDIIRLGGSADDTVRISVDGKERFIGQMGLRRFCKSVQVTSIIDSEKDALKRVLREFERKRKGQIGRNGEMLCMPKQYEEDKDE